MKRFLKKGLIAAAVFLLLAGGMTAVAATNADGTWTWNAPSGAKTMYSKGSIVYQQEGEDAVVFDAADIHTLASEITDLEQSYKTGIADALNALDIASVLPKASASASFSTLQDRILSSQQIITAGQPVYVNVHTGALASVAAEDEEDVLQMQMSGATANALSAGTAAWVDGVYVEGTGADNAAFYENGYVSGYQAGDDAGYDTGYGDGYEAGYGDGDASG